MPTLAASLLLSVSFALQPDAALRLYNPHAAAVDATVDCAGTLHQVRVEAGDTKDIASCATAAIEAPLPLTAFETMHEDGVETQRLLGADAACEGFAVQAPLFGCRLGTASVAVPQVDGATYAWSVEGGSVADGQGTNRLILTLGEGTSARVSVTVAGECTATAEAVISLRAPLVVQTFDVPAAATANAETTIEWSYANGLTPASQLLSGEAFEAPVPLGGDVRSYKWTPKTTGAKTVELRASYATSIPVNPVRRRRRAAGSTRAAAAECPAALASARVEVGGCGTLNANIDAPEDVEAGSTFTAAIFLRTGETVKWTVEGGTILSGDTSDTVTVKAGDLPGNIELFALVTAGPGCHETAEARIDVVERAACNTAPPAAALSVESVGCDSATIRGTFTGTPPFSGTWSDGTAFRTSDSSTTHEFKKPSAYTIQNFRDGLCAGEVTQTARVTSFGPTAAVTVVGGTCLPGAKAVATFTGTPPFTGKWYWGEWFTTDETSVEKAEFVAAVAQIEVIRDARCPNSLNSSNAVQLEPRTTARLRGAQYCTTGFQWFASLEVDVITPPGVRPPFTVYWSDGEVTQGGTNDYTIRRSVSPKADTDYSIVRVAGRTCDAIIDPDRDTATVAFRPRPEIDHAASDIEACAGSPQKFRVKPGYHPSAIFEWSIDKGTIVSGQGTPEVTVLQERGPGGKVTLTTTYPGRPDCVEFPHTIQTYVYTAPEILDFSIQPSTIPPGGTAQIHYRMNAEVEWAGLGASPDNRNSDFSIANSDCTNIYGLDCTIPYKDSHGPGLVSLTFSVGNECGSVERTIVLEVK